MECKKRNSSRGSIEEGEEVKREKENRRMF